MARYKILSLSFIDNRLVQPDEKITVSRTVIPGSHWEPLDAEAKAAFAKAGFGLPAPAPDDSVKSDGPVDGTGDDDPPAS